MSEPDALPDTAVKPAGQRPAGFADLPPVVPGYEVGAEIGRGGMGVVYAAREVGLDREVAVKTLQVGMSARRFEREARITARLPHPHIPPVYALGTLPDGRPYLAMKLVRGRTLDVLLRERPDPGHDLPRFVQVFEGVCQAVGYAHARGVVHRDLKPGNVMVGEFGEVQVMDWGLAKDLGDADTLTRTEVPALGGSGPTADGRAADTDDHTRAGSGWGTPGFMPPEQAEGRWELVGPRADVYALGSVLCAILTGQAAYRGPAEAADRLAACGTDPELVALASRCLASDPSGRPADAGAVARAVADHQAGVADRLRAAEVGAAEERTWRRTVQRWAVAVAAVLLLGIGGTAAGLVRANQARADEAAARQAAEAAGAAEAAEAANARAAEGRADERAREERVARERAEDVAGFMRDVFAQASADGQAGKDRRVNQRLTVKEAMDFAAKRLDGRLADRPELEAALRQVIGNTYRELAAYPEAEVHLARDLALLERLRGPDHPDTMGSVNNLAILAAERGDLAAAARLQERALGVLVRSRGPKHPDTLRATSNLGAIERLAGGFARARGLLDEALAGQTEVLGPDHPHTLKTLVGLAGLLYDRGDRGAAEPLLERAVAAHERAAGPDHPDTLEAVGMLAVVRHSRGDWAGAERLYDRLVADRGRVFGPEHPHTLQSVDNLASILRDRGDLAGAAGLAQRAAAGREKALGPDHPDTLTSVARAAQIEMERGRLSAAAPLARRAAAGFGKVFGPDHPQALQVEVILAELEEAGGNPSAARRRLERALVGLGKAHGPDHPLALAAVNNLAQLTKAQGDLAAAERLFLRALAGSERANGPDHPNTLTVVNNLAAIYSKRDEYAAAQPLYRRVLAGWERTLGPDHPDYLNVLANLGVSHVLSGRPADGVPLLERADRFRARYPAKLGWVQGRLVQAYAEAGRAGDAARVIADQIADGRRTLRPGGADLGGLLASAGLRLLDLDPAAAEPVLRECLELRDKLAPKAWNTANAKSLLGDALFLQGRPAEAEPLLVAGYEGLVADRRNIPPQGLSNLPDAASRLARVYLALGKPDEAARWRAERQKYPPDTAPRPRTVVRVAPPPREATRP